MITHPMVNPEALKMDQTKRAKLWEKLPDQIANLRKTIELMQDLDELVTEAKLNGPTDTFEKYEEIAKAKFKAMGMAQLFIQDFATFEREYLKWMATIYGEEIVTNKLAKAMKGLE